MNGQISKNGCTNFHFIFEELSDEKKNSKKKLKKSHLHIVAAGCRWSCARPKIRSRGLKFCFQASNIMKQQNPEFKVDPLKLVNFGTP